MNDEQNISNAAPNRGAQGIFHGNVTIYQGVTPPETAREWRNRAVMLQKVSDFWVNGVLENSLHRAAPIDLDMVSQPDAVAYPWETLIERPDPTPHALPAGTSIAGVFDNLGGDLLILGAPGSGKTTLLLELARTLIARAQQDATHPMPVVFNLSSWAAQHPPLADWLVDELNIRYDVPRKVAQAWLATDQVLPLLDGLDEVRPDARTACVAAINSYRQEHGLVGMVVCCRVTAYTTLTAKLKLRGAVVLQPLTDAQIDRYVMHAGAALTAVRTLVRDDAEIRALATTPLMVHILTLAYQDMPLDLMATRESRDAWRRHLFATYVARMLQRRGTDPRYPAAQTCDWLAWLADLTYRQQQAVFALDGLQPTACTTAAQQRQFVLLSGLVAAGAHGLLGACSGALIGVGYGTMYAIAKWLAAGGAIALTIPIGTTATAGLFFGLLGGSLGGLVTSMLISPGQVTDTAPSASPWSPGWASLLAGLVGGVSAGLAGGFVPGMPNHLLRGVLSGIGVGVGCGLIVWVVGRHRRIMLDTPLRWAWTRLRRGLLLGVGTGLAVGLPGSLLAGPVFGLFWGIFLGMLVLLVAGLDPAWVPTTTTTRTKIHRAVRSTVLASGIGGIGVIVSAMLTGALVGAFQIGLSGTLGDGALGGLGFGLYHGLSFGSLLCALFGSAFGGLAVVHHLVLRILLTTAGAMSWNHSQFLDYAAERVLLRKVGHHYTFAHRLIQEYFASLKPAAHRRLP